MRAHSGMTSYEFIMCLRDAAIRNNASPMVIDKIDELQTVEDLELDLEKTGDELTEAEEARDDLFDELKTLVEAIENSDLPTEEDKDVSRALEFANKALVRHK
jgi:hypothetical protein